MDDVERQNLEAEGVHIKDTGKVRTNLRLNGATPAEVDFLCGGERVELNAFTSQGLIAWIEDKLKQIGVKKVIPAQELLSAAYRRAFVQQAVRDAIPKVTRRAKRRLHETGIPADLRARVESHIAANPATPWDVAVAALAEQDAATR
jgi:hypothetical protein